MASFFQNLIFTAIRDIQLTRYSELASSAIIVYDHLATLDDEVELIWKSPWSTGKFLFILNRYFGLSTVIFNNYALFGTTLTNSVRLHWFRWQGWTGLIACMIAEVILQMRLYALYFFNKKVLVVMITSFILSSSASATVMGTVLSGITATSHPLPGVTFCVPSGVSKHFYAFWIPILSFESLLCGLALFRGFQAVVLDDSLFRSGRRLVNVLIRDSVLYFLVMFATYVTNLLVWIAAPQNLLEIPIGFSVAMSCVMGNRIILNIRLMNKESEPSKQTEGRKSTSHCTSFFSRSQVLTELEMSELRAMRVDPTRGQVIVV